MSSNTRLSILEGASDITRVFCSSSSERWDFFALLHQCEPDKKEVVSKGTSTFHPYQFFRCKATNKMFQNKSRSIFTSIILFLFVTLKLTPFLAKLCIFCFFILSSKPLGLLLQFFNKFFTSSISKISDVKKK